jgi:hypothetical protein
MSRRSRVGQAGVTCQLSTCWSGHSVRSPGESLRMVFCVRSTPIPRSEHSRTRASPPSSPIFALPSAAASLTASAVNSAVETISPRSSTPVHRAAPAPRDLAPAATTAWPEPWS